MCCRFLGFLIVVGRVMCRGFTGDSRFLIRGVLRLRFNSGYVGCVGGSFNACV